MDYLCNVFFIVSFLYIWLNENFVPEYGKLFKLKFLKYKEFFEHKGMSVNYCEFLLINYDSFIIKIITCPICFSIWLNILSYIIFGFEFKYIGISVFLTWILYFNLIKLIKKSYD